VFNPKLNNRPVIVLSNNDGCAVSRSNEAKSLGIAMGEPFFKIKQLVQEHDIAVLSSNFALYGDLSTRVMSIITQMMPDVDIYSIDEAFIDLSNMQQDLDIYTLCLDLAQKIERYTGIPVSIGIAATKTLAKVANHIAKKNNLPERVFYLDNPDKTANVLKKFKIRDVWGIGRKLERRLHAMGVYTAAQLINLPQSAIESSFNVVLQRTILELQGVSSIVLPENVKNKQQIMVSRSFGQRVTELIYLQEAISTYASMACEKLRCQSLFTQGIYVFLHTGLYGATDTVYKNSLYINLPAATNDTRTIIHYAKAGLKKIFKFGYRYQKVGIILCDLCDAAIMQIDLFAHNNINHSDELMGLIDEINHKFGKDTVQFAAAGLNKTWKNQLRRRSGEYTSCWDELPVVYL
jgi:DNA polymerase V